MISPVDTHVKDMKEAKQGTINIANWLYITYNVRYVGYNTRWVTIRSTIKEVVGCFQAGEEESIII